MKKRFKITLFLIILLIFIIVGIFLFKVFNKSEDNNQVKVLDSIENFDYTLDERDTKLMKDTYNELKSLLKEKNIDNESYAKCIAKLFVIDLFTLDNKINKYDVGSSEYVYPDSLENYKINVEDTLYKTIEDNSKGKRDQELPVVKNVEIKDYKTGEYLVEEEKYESFIINLSWEYEKDLGYDSSATITLIKKANKIYVVEYAVGEENA